MDINLRLYLVTDEPHTGDRGVPATVRLAIAGGATVVQLRNKTASTRELMTQARALLSICRPEGVALLINDRVDVALASGADGVHLGQSDMEARDARRLLGPDAIIGVSIRNEAEIEAAQGDGATYLAANGVWTTATKTDFGAPLGCEGLRKLVAMSRLPMVAIGGIGVEQAPMISEAGCAGIAVVSAVMKAPDPRQACMALRQAFGR